MLTCNIIWNIIWIFSNFYFFRLQKMVLITWNVFFSDTCSYFLTTFWRDSFFRLSTSPCLFGYETHDSICICGFKFERQSKKARNRLKCAACFQSNQIKLSTDSAFACSPAELVVVPSAFEMHSLWHTNAPFTAATSAPNHSDRFSRSPGISDTFAVSALCLADCHFWLVDTYFAFIRASNLRPGTATQSCNIRTRSALATFIFKVDNSLFSSLCDGFDAVVCIAVHLCIFAKS